MKARREEITRLIDEQGKLNQELVDRINGAATMTELEDIYSPTGLKANPGYHSQGERS